MPQRQFRNLSHSDGVEVQHPDDPNTNEHRSPTVRNLHRGEQDESLHSEYALTKISTNITPPMVRSTGWTHEGSSNVKDEISELT